jgi:hypothetical protein
VNSFVSGWLPVAEISGDLLVNQVKDVPIHWFSACAANEETVNILQLNEVFSVGFSDRPTIYNPGLFAHFLADVLSKPVSHVFNSFLCLISRTDLSCVECPDRLVSNDDVVPSACLLKDRLDLVQLVYDNFIAVF